MAWSDPGYLYTYGLCTESWIEISSNPSASSLSSAGDDIVTTGPNVRPDALRQRRNIRSTAPIHLNITNRPQNVGRSSQDEYEGSESESDKQMSSSNEGLQLPLPSLARPSSSSEDGASEAISDDDEISTAINYRPSDTCFTPQPNAFSHPPSNQTTRNPQLVSGSYFPAASRPANRNAVQRHSYSHPRQQHSPFNAISPSYQADHDAALRASLSTLLSCAAAARGLPKSSSRTNTLAAPSGNQIDASTLRMVPESVALGQSEQGSSPAEPPFNPTLQRPSSSSRTTSSDSKNSADIPYANTRSSKRKANAGTNNTGGTAAAASGGRSSSKDRRVAKKPKRSSGNPSAQPYHWASGSSTGAALDVSPTLLTWIVSAGVVVLVSALSFGAGFSIGREAGRAEALGFTDGLSAGDGGLRNASRALVGCGRETGGWAGGGWKSRLRWSGMVGGASSMVA